MDKVYSRFFQMLQNFCTQLCFESNSSTIRIKNYYFPQNFPSLYPPRMTVPRHRLCLHICVIRLPFQQTRSNFYLPALLFFFLLSLFTISLFLSDRIITTDITRSKRRDRGWWNVIADLAALIEAAVSSFGQISISISIICSTLIRDWKRRGSMEFFFSKSPANLRNSSSRRGLFFKVWNRSNTFLLLLSSFSYRWLDYGFCYISTKIRMFLLESINFWRIIDDNSSIFEEF